MEADIQRPPQQRLAASMSPSVLSRKKLWGHAGNQCAWSGCSNMLIVNLEDPDSSDHGNHNGVIGQEAHIRSRRTEGPRHDPAYANVDGYDNLILLCPTHHDVIDKNNGAAWSVDRIEQMKATHEKAVHAALNPSDQSTRTIQEALAASIDRWADPFLDMWPYAARQMSAGYPRINQDVVAALAELNTWLLGQNWPDSHPGIAAAIARWQHLSSTLIEHIDDTFEAEPGRPTLRLSLLHKRSDVSNEGEYALAHEQFARNCLVVWWLVYELTMTTNLLIEAVRSELDPLFRSEEGLVVIEVGDSSMLLTYEDDWHALPPIPSNEAVIAAAEAERTARDLPTVAQVNALGLAY